MKTISRLFGVMALALTTVTAYAQDQWVIKFKDGTSNKFNIDDIEQMYSEEGHNFVDLGLSINWATCNVGAAAPEEYGDYFAWGETEPYYSSQSPLVWKDGKSAGYAWDSYFDSKYTIYNTDGGKTVIALENDAAYVNWGDDWRMPTQVEQAELYNFDNCTWTWYAKGNDEFGGVAGYKVTSKISGFEGNFIFLPAAGFRRGTNIVSAGSNGCYWFSMLSQYASNSAHYFDLSSSYRSTNSDYRYRGHSVRPVRPVTVTDITLSNGAVEMATGTFRTLTSTLSPSRTSNYTVTWSSSNTDVATVDQSGMITAVSKGSCTITASCQDVSATCTVTVKNWEPQSVDLGLSVKWATCNVGAKVPEEFGDYFAWGETEPYYSNYSTDYTEWKDGKSSGYVSRSYFDSDFSKYNISGGKTVLDLDDDAARANWGGNWRMPTQAEQAELCNTDNCTWTWYSSGNDEFGGVAGYKVTSNKPGYEGNFIFLPAAGYFSSEYSLYMSAEGTYWSSTLKESSSKYTYYLSSTWYEYKTTYDERYYGRSVRPVCVW